MVFLVLIQLGRQSTIDIRRDTLLSGRGLVAGREIALAFAGRESSVVGRGIALAFAGRGSLFAGRGTSEADVIEGFRRDGISAWRLTSGAGVIGGSRRDGITTTIALSRTQRTRFLIVLLVTRKAVIAFLLAGRVVVLAPKASDIVVTPSALIAGVAITLVSSIRSKSSTSRVLKLKRTYVGA